MEGDVADVVLETRVRWNKVAVFCWWIQGDAPTSRQPVIDA